MLEFLCDDDKVLKTFILKIFNNAIIKMTMKYQPHKLCHLDPLSLFNALSSDS